ncbi:hypothetical protein Q4512_15425 [Oceanihabitans sp. 2_MG-2023]|uniref:hypothetical protein n=1 Tax=Oceanihabitans sp. 2_MG-2023 TaxID=3062661 RepID=UPI0026E439CC|nr:hypothetical protein [Oceanihabitans sp. 2_MG-2023]MDO6598314.1 hypothetical protein [Oceanihabitans sp. 2_MG-2023]
MKKLNVLFILIIAFLLVSCNSDDDNSTTSNTSINLTSIKKDYYINDAFSHSSNYSFEENKLIKVEHSYGRSEELFYENDLVSNILKYDASNNLEWTNTYTYDNAKRLIQKNSISSSSNPSANQEKEITYTDNSNIQVLFTLSSTQTTNENITLNPENLIIENKLLNDEEQIMSEKHYEYINNNLTRFEIKDPNENTLLEATFEYLDMEASDFYNYNIFTYGPEWKNNYALDTQFGLGIETYQISKNYISSYYRYDYDINISRTVTFDYEFDSNDNIVEQIENMIESDGDTYKTVTTYNYE